MGRAAALAEPDATGAKKTPSRKRVCIFLNLLEATWSMRLRASAPSRKEQPAVKPPTQAAVGWSSNVGGCPWNVAGRSSASNASRQRFSVCTAVPSVHSLPGSPSAYRSVPSACGFEGPHGPRTGLSIEHVAAQTS
eukprot:5768810-Prymnesium_polylepis.1